LNFGPSVIGCVEGFIGRLEKLKGATIEKRNFIRSQKKLATNFLAEDLVMEFKMITCFPISYYKMIGMISIMYESVVHIFIHSLKQNKNMHCLQCLPLAVAESSYTPSQFIMGVAILKVMPRPLCPSPKKLLCICKSMSSLPASKNNYLFP